MTIKDKFNGIITRIKSFCEGHADCLTTAVLFVIFYFIFFRNLGTYPLMDVDETRYVAMARDMFQSKDFMTLFLNGEFFFEKPPLYFWQECLSFAIFGKINEFTARFPVALLGFILSFAVYFFSKNVIGRKFATLTSLILATSLEFLMLSKYAILDIVLTFYTGLALLSYFKIYFCKEENKKYYWWAFYVFCALAVMAKGIPGVAIPFGVVFFTSIAAKKFKEIFKPVYIFPGICLFFLIVLPWHIIMLKTHNPLFFDEYIIKHHIHRFINTENNEIGRKQPFYYYFVTVLWGFIPWIFSVIAVIAGKLKSLKGFDIVSAVKTFNFESLDNSGKLKVLCWISFGWIMLFFSSSSTKLITYILPVYLFIAVLTGFVWDKYIRENKYEKPVNISAAVFASVCLVGAIAAIFTPLFLPAGLNSDIAGAKIICIVIMLIFGFGTVLGLKYKKNLIIFIMNVFFMSAVSAFATGELFKVDYKFGQNDLMEFAKLAKDNNYTISAFGINRKYSLLYYGEQKIDYNEDIDISAENITEDLMKDNNVVIIKTKVLNEIVGLKDYQTVAAGRRYTMIKGK